MRSSNENHTKKIASIKNKKAPYPTSKQSQSDKMSAIDFSKKDTLVVGSPPEGCSTFDGDSTLFTGCTNTEKNTLDWVDLTIRRVVPQATFSKIVLFSVYPFFTSSGGKDPRKLNAIFSTLKAGGEIHVVLKTRKSGDMHQILVDEDFSPEGDTFAKEKNGKAIPFTVFRRRRTQEEIAVLSDSAEYSVGFTPPKEYSSMNLNFKLKKKLKSSGFSGKRTGITLPELRKEIDDDDFITRYTQSILNLLNWKTKVYSQKQREISSAQKIMKEKIRVFIKKGVDESQIKDYFPLYPIYTCLLVELETILEQIKFAFERTTEKIVKHNLILALEDDHFGFGSIVGRDEIKDSFAGMIYSFSRNWKTFTNTFNNICLMGNSGVGKTCLAKVLGYVFCLSGMLVRTNTRIVTPRADLVGQYIGQTAIRTRSVLYDSLEGVLLIDEAYQFTPKNSEKDYGPEAVTELVNFLDKYIGLGVVVVAGYEEPMKTQFLDVNEGLPRRFPTRIVLENYSQTELTDILVRGMAERIDGRSIDGSEKTLTNEVCNYLFSVVGFLDETQMVPHQAGDMLNLGACIIKAMYSSYRVRWDFAAPLEHNKPIFERGIQNFLSAKGYEI